MIRGVFTIVAVLSLLLCLTIGVSWIVVPRLSPRSLQFHSSFHDWEIDPSGEHFNLRVEGGTRLPSGGLRAPKGQHWDTNWANPTISLPLGFSYGINPANDPTAAPFFELVAPWYWLIILAAVLPIIWIGLFILRRRRMRHVIEHNLCPVCGYDLRSTPDRCPECGASVPVATSLSHSPHR
jgi:hypothetical protein